MAALVDNSEAYISLILQDGFPNSPSHIRKLAYLTLIRPKIEYASAIWDPSQEYIIRDIESLRNHAVHFIFSDCCPYSSGTAPKNRVELVSLSLRRQHARLTFFP